MSTAMDAPKHSDVPASAKTYEHVAAAFSASVFEIAKDVSRTVNNIEKPISDAVRRALGEGFSIVDTAARISSMDPAAREQMNKRIAEGTETNADRIVLSNNPLGQLIEQSSGGLKGLCDNHPEKITGLIAEAMNEGGIAKVKEIFNNANTASVADRDPAKPTYGFFLCGGANGPTDAGLDVQGKLGLGVLVCGGGVGPIGLSVPIESTSSHGLLTQFDQEESLRENRIDNKRPEGANSLGQTQERAEKERDLIRTLSDADLKTVGQLATAISSRDWTRYGEIINSKSKTDVTELLLLSFLEMGRLGQGKDFDVVYNDNAKAIGVLDKGRPDASGKYNAVGTYHYIDTKDTSNFSKAIIVTPDPPKQNEAQAPATDTDPLIPDMSGEFKPRSPSGAPQPDDGSNLDSRSDAVPPTDNVSPAPDKSDKAGLKQAAGTEKASLDNKDNAKELGALHKPELVGITNRMEAALRTGNINDFQNALNDWKHLQPDQHDKDLAGSFFVKRAAKLGYIARNAPDEHNNIGFVLHRPGDTEGLQLAPDKAPVAYNDSTKEDDQAHPADVLARWAEASKMETEAGLKAAMQKDSSLSKLIDILADPKAGLIYKMHQQYFAKVGDYFRVAYEHGYGGNTGFKGAQALARDLNLARPELNLQLEDTPVGVRYKLDLKHSEPPLTVGGTWDLKNHENDGGGSGAKEISGQTGLETNPGRSHPSSNEAAEPIGSAADHSAQHNATDAAEENQHVENLKGDITKSLTLKVTEGDLAKGHLNDDLRHYEDDMLHKHIKQLVQIKGLKALQDVIESVNNADPSGKNKFCARKDQDPGSKDTYVRLSIVPKDEPSEEVMYYDVNLSD